jgi:hypothetical protein
MKDLFHFIGLFQLTRPGRDNRGRIQVGSIAHDLGELTGNRVLNDLSGLVFPGP